MGGSRLRTSCAFGGIITLGWERDCSLDVGVSSLGRGEVLEAVGGAGVLAARGVHSMYFLDACL